MITKFAGLRGLVVSEFRDLNHAGEHIILVSSVIPKWLGTLAMKVGELRNRNTMAGSTVAVRSR
jgi:hypothetical protein